MAVMYTGCSLLFLLGLKNFTAKLKVAYGIFCGAVIMFALSELTVPIGTVVEQFGYTWLPTAGLLLMIVGSICGMYVGVKLFANLFSVKSLWSKPWLVIALGIVTAVAAFFLPIGPNVGMYDEGIEAAKGNNSLMALALVLFLASSMLAFHIKQKVTVTYKKALSWFFAALLSFVAVTIITMGAIILLGNGHWFIGNGYSILTQAVLALFLLKAAYEFNAIGTLVVTTKPASAVNIVDIVVATAQKASDFAAIDPWLDTLRSTTARLGPGQQPSKEDEVLLIRTYQELERYLEEKEPVRRYTKEELRRLIRKELKISGSVFFDNLK
jgi:hypothetical protein